jgi:hypothetical protein
LEERRGIDYVAVAKVTNLAFSTASSLLNGS